MNIMDFANDDNFQTAWQSNPAVQAPWIEIDLGISQAFNMISIVEDGDKNNIRKCHIEYLENNTWKSLPVQNNNKKTKIERFDTVWGKKVKVCIYHYVLPPSIAEIGIYNEKR
jgi:alpha-L-fucosidase